MIFQVPFLAFWRLGRSADWWPLTHLQRKTCLPSFYRSIRVLGCTTRKSVRKVSRSQFFPQAKNGLKKIGIFFSFPNFRDFCANLEILDNLVRIFQFFLELSSIFVILNSNLDFFFSEFGRLWGDFIFFSILIRIFLRFFQRGIFRYFILPEFLRF